MPDWLPPVLFAGLFFSVCVFAIRSANSIARLENSRAKHLADAAKQIGWEFVPDEDRDFAKRFPMVKAFDHTSASCGFNQLRGFVRVESAWGKSLRYETLAGDYRSPRENRSDVPPVWQCQCLSYLLIRTPCVGAETLCLRSERLADKAGDIVGRGDIDFESKAFSDRFFVQASSRRFAYDILHPRMIDFLLDSPAVAIDISGGLVCVTPEGSMSTLHWQTLGISVPHIDHPLYRRYAANFGDARWKREELPPMIEWVSDFLSLWPRHLLSEKGAADKRG